MVLVRRAAEPGCHRSRGGRLLCCAACAYDRADLDAGADLDSYSRTYVDTCANMDACPDLHAYACADLDSGANADSHGGSRTYRDCHAYCYSYIYTGADRDSNAYAIAYRNAHGDS